MGTFEIFLKGWITGWENCS